MSKKARLPDFGRKKEDGCSMDTVETRALHSICSVGIKNSVNRQHCRMQDVVVTKVDKGINPFDDLGDSIIHHCRH